MPPKALIFDVDGTLAETEEWHRHAFNDTFAADGIGWHWDRAAYAVLLEVTGGKERMRHHAARIGAQIDDAAIARLHAAKTARYVAFVDSGAITLRPGIARLLHEARAASVRLAIATTTSPQNVAALLAATLGPGSAGLFDVIGAGDMVAAKKPAPDIYGLVLERLRLPPQDCIAFEDTPNGLHAAMGAGIPTIVTTSLYGGTTGFTGARSVLDSLGEPDAPCRALAGTPPAGPCLTLADFA